MEALLSDVSLDTNLDQTVLASTLGFSLVDLLCHSAAFYQSHNNM